MNDAYAIHYTAEAAEDLTDIYAYIAFDLQAPDAAKGQVNRIRQEIRSLDLLPSRYERVRWEPWKSMGMHKVPVDRFVIYYTVDDEHHTVTIVRIFYGGRDVERIIRREKT